MHGWVGWGRSVGVCSCVCEWGLVGVLGGEGWSIGGVVGKRSFFGGVAVVVMMMMVVAMVCVLACVHELLSIE